MTKSEEYFLRKKYKSKGTKFCECCGLVFNIYLHRDLSRKRFCSRECFGKINSKLNNLKPPRPTEEVYKKIGRKIREKIRNGEMPPPPKNNRKGIPLFKNRGENHPNWIKDRTKLKMSRFNCSERRGQIAAWRTDVYRRDDYTCQQCGTKGGKLNAHHIKPWAQYPDDRYDINNGTTLCVKCHKEAHKKIKENATDSTKN